MFYSDFVLSKKGPLARIWLAAHWDKKLTKAQIFETNIESSIERILKPKVKLALRTSGHLMLGVVRIYSRKTKYLLADCNEAFVKIKMAFRPGMVDLPEDHREAAVNAVTLPEVFHDFDSAMPDLNDVDIEAQFTLNQSRADEITMREDYGNVPTLHAEDGFDLGFGASSSDLLRESVGFDQSLQQANLLFGEGIDGIDKHKDRPSTSDVSVALGHISMDVDMPKDDGFGAVTGGGLFEGGLFEDTPMPEVPVIDGSLHMHDPMHLDGAIPSTSKHTPMQSPMRRLDGPGPSSMRLNDDDDFDDDHFIPPSPGGGSSDGSRPHSPISAVPPSEMGVVGTDHDRPAMSNEEQFNLPNDIVQAVPSTSAEAQLAADAGLDKDALEQNENNQNAEQTTLLQNEEESFALAPVDASALRGLPKTKRKRKLIVDEVKNISGEEMKAQLSDTSDIVITLDLAPPTKRLMHWKETGGVEKLFALPGKGIPSTSLFKNYQRHLTSRAAPNDEDEHDGIKDPHHEPLEMAPPIAPPAPTRRGRKRKQAVVDDEPAPIEASAVQETSKKSKMSPVPNETAAPEHDQNIRLPVIAEESASTNEIAPVPETSMDLAGDISVPDISQIQETSLSAPPAYPEPFPDLQGQPMSEITPFPDISQQPLDNLLQPMSVPPPVPSVQDDSTKMPDSVENNLSINNHQNSLMENMGYDERDQDLHQQMQNSNLFSFNNDDHDHAPITPGMHGAVTPWHEADYDNPASICPMEERGDDETVEQFEERILNKRAGHLYSTIRMRISTGVTTTFSDLIVTNPKKQVAQKFYSLLVLKKHRVLELTQNEPYDVILLTKGPNFDDPKL